MVGEEALAKDGIKLGREWLIRSPVTGTLLIAILGGGYMQYRSYMAIQEQNNAMFASLQDLHTRTNGQLVDVTRDTVKSNAELKSAVESLKDLVRDNRMANRRQD